MVRRPDRSEADLETIAGRPEGFGGSLRSAAQWLLADVYYRLGAFDDAMVAAELARSALQDTGRAKSPEIAMACAVAAYTASARGDWATHEATSLRSGRRPCRQHPSSSVLARRPLDWSLAVALDDPQGMLEAARAFEAAADAPELSLFPFGPVMAEALWRNRRLDEAAGRLVAYEARARQLGRVSAMVGASRVRGLLEASRHDAGAALRAFDEAVPLAERLPQPLEAARFMAAHGAVLARLGRRTAALRKTAEARSILGRSAPCPISSVPTSNSSASAHARHRSRTGELTALRWSWPASLPPGCPTSRPPTG